MGIFPKVTDATLCIGVFGTFSIFFIINAVSSVLLVDASGVSRLRNKASRSRLSVAQGCDSIVSMLLIAASGYPGIGVLKISFDNFLKGNKAVERLGLFVW